MKFLKKIFDHEYKEMTHFKEIANKIDALDEEISKLSDEKLQKKTEEFKKRLSKGETLDDILVEAFAVVREAGFRMLGEKAYYTQILGGLALHYGNMAELRTGEGKTLAATMPAYLNALTGNGVHIITVNEYLAGRDANWMGSIFRFLGLTVAANFRELSPKEKQDAYNSDILYSTNNEIGFDYLRDNMVVRKEDRVQRPFNFVIIDEADSVLIDEARTPLIISGGAMHSANLYRQTDRFVKGLKENDGYLYDVKTKAVTLDVDGVARAEKAFGVANLFDLQNTNLVHFINQALKANYAMKNDVDYVVEEGKVVIVDPFTGRLMHGRAYSDGLHQAIEAKEGVEIQEETMTLATITFQNLFRMYKKISGMTGTAKTEEEEFREIYNMYVIQVPTNKPIARIDYGDLIYSSYKGKFGAIVKEIKERHKTGQPVLVGTVAVETSEMLSEMLKKEHIPHDVLNAKNHQKETELIANAGQKGAVTIATNMAGRGADIKLGEGVKELGGLAIIGTERHESRRIDNQLRGRSGRQGDVGFSQFYVSFEDELLVRFAADKAKGLLKMIGVEGETAIRNKTLSNIVEQAQKRVEGTNYDIRKTLLEYDDVINRQRDTIYKKRNEILDSESIHESVLNTIDNYIYDFVLSHNESNGQISDVGLDEILEFVNSSLLKKAIKKESIKSLNPEEIVDYIVEKIIEEYDKKLNEVPENLRNEFEKAISLRVIDTYWMEHINTMSVLREGIHLRGYANENPLRAYTNEGFELFEDLLINIDKQITLFLVKAEIRQNTERKQVIKAEVTNDGKEQAKKQPKKVTKVGRNDSCPCGSGKKYKQCCGK